MLDVQESEGVLEVFSIKKASQLNVLTSNMEKFFLIFSSEIWFHTYIGTDSRDLANGNPLFTCISTLIQYVSFIRCMIYLFTAIVLSLGGRSTVHIYTQKILRTIQNKQYIEQHNNFGRVRAVPRLGQLYLGICLKPRKSTEKSQSGQPRLRIRRQQ